MSVLISNVLSDNLKARNIQPNMVLEIDGVSTVYGAISVKKLARYGQVELTYGLLGLVYGGYIDINDQEKLISLDGTTTTIRQTLEPDKGRGSSISTMQIRLIDQDEKMTKLITPGNTVAELMFKKCKIWWTAGIGDFKDDYIPVFRGIIDEIHAGQGYVVLNLAASNQKARQTTFTNVETSLTTTITSGDTSIVLDDASDLVTKITHPVNGGGFDPALRTFIVIDTEIIEYDSISGSTLTVTSGGRGAFGTIAAAHTSGDDVTSFYTLEDDVMALALKLMLSDKNQTKYLIAFAATSVEKIDSLTTVDNAFIFKGTDVGRDYGVRTGDYVTSANFTDAGNNLAALTEILDVVKTDTGSYIVVDATLTLQVDSAVGDVSFLSKYNSLGEGIGMVPDEVDIAKHEFLQRTFLSSFEYRFYLKDSVENTYEFIEQQLFKPYACYSIPINGQASVGFTIGPIPGVNLKTISKDNIINPSQITLRRSTNKNYMTQTIHKYEDSLPVIDENQKYLRGTVTKVGSPQVPTGARSFVIEAKGMRTDLFGGARSTSSGNRLLTRYKTGAEYITGIQVSLAVGIQINPGDIIILDPDGLNIANTVDGNRDKPSALYEVVNRIINLKTGDAKLDIVDTNLNINARNALMSPSSLVKNGVSTTKFEIERYGGGSPYGANEFRKWENYPAAVVKVRNADFSIVGTSQISNISANTITLLTALAFTPTAGMIMELADYDLQTSANVKLVYGHMSDGTNNFGDGGVPYVMF